jgi:hypothetical protein
MVTFWELTVCCQPTASIPTKAPDGALGCISISVVCATDEGRQHIRSTKEKDPNNLGILDTIVIIKQ